MAASRTSAVCVLVSGGVDSAFLLAQLLRSHAAAPVYVRCGLRWEAAELHWLRQLLRALRSPHLRPLRVVRLPLRSLYGPHWSLTGRRAPSAESPDAAVYLPGRNMLLLGCAGVVCAQAGAGPSAIALGTLAGNPFGDATPAFFRRMAACLSQALDRRIRILTPLRRLRKARLIRCAAKVPLHLTFSCIRPRGMRHCGRCNKCAERQAAFRAAGVVDRTGQVYFRRRVRWRK